MKFSFLLPVLLSSLLLGATFGEPNPKAKVGGTFTFNLRGEPNTLHPIKAIDFYSRRIFDYTMDSLALQNANTGEFEPRLAEKWEISKDQKTLTFTLREGLVFHDGHPLTAEDVVFSFDVILNPDYESHFLKPFYENLEKIESRDSKTIVFTAKRAYYKTFDQIANRIILPKHIYGNPKGASSKNKDLVGSGPYKMSEFNRGDKITLKRFSDWYGFKKNLFEGSYNFDRIVAKFIRDETLALEMLKKGEIDYTELRPEAYQLKTSGEPWGNKIKKVKYQNREPKNWYFYGFNLKNPLFKSLKVRLALSHLMDRESMASKLLFGFSQPAAAPIWFQNPAHPPHLKPLKFDPVLAARLLKEEGWSDSDGDEILDKVIDKKKVPFKFTMIYPSRDYEKFHTWFQEDLRAVGIEMEIKLVDWYTFEPLLKKSSFEMMALAWGGGDQEPDPKQLWHSSSIGEGGSNYVNFQNKEVDKLIDSARMESDKNKRTRLFQKIYEKIVSEAPYVFWFDTLDEFYGVSSRIQRPADTMKYKVGLHTWWVD